MPDDKYRKKNWKGTLISVVAIVVSLIVVVGCLLGGYLGIKIILKNHKKKSTAAQQETQLSGQIESVQRQRKKRWFTTVQIEEQTTIQTTAQTYYADKQ